MYRVELYAAVRRAVYVEGISEREASRRFGIARKTVHKMLGYSAPPGYQRKQPVKRPKLEAFLGVIDQILEADRQQIRKQRHTSKRIFERLRQEHGYTGGYTVVKDYVREQKLQQKEMFVPLSHPPGHAQVDFGEADIVLNGKIERAHFFAMDLPHSDAAFVMAFPTETSEAFAEGHNQAFAHFGAVPQSIVYDNTKLAVARILGDGTRRRTQTFTELVSHYLFQERFGRPGKGNDKGKVEGLVGYARRNFFVPAPRCTSYAELNERLQAECRLQRERKLRGQSETIGARLERDLASMLALPPVPYEACAKVTTRVTSLSLVRFDRNDYSVPTAFGHRQVLVKGFVDQVVISCGAEEIARHDRSYEREDMIFEPRHYLALLEQKTNALDQAAPLQNWELPEEITGLRRLLEARLGKRGKREYVQILRLLEIFPLELVRTAAADAQQLQAISFDAVKHLLLCRLEQKPPRLDLENYPHLPNAQVAMTLAQDYASLLTELA
ncbi:MAG TPA: IS21 family transposase [Acidobacteriaceae bacterium]|nr:IS21 family transposase [Acidobacteriaceae bacterium]